MAAHQSCWPLVAAGSWSLLLLANIGLQPAGAQETAVPALVDRIEEDWHLVVGDPDPEADSPQILNVMSPLATIQDEHAVFEINHVTQPEYTSGGLQLQRWMGPEHCVDFTPVPDYGTFACPGEEVRYTLRMSIRDSILYYSVRNGSSQTWGSFGSPGQIWLAVPTSLKTLSRYSPDFSASESKVAFGTHRVEKFERTEIRYYWQGQVVAKDQTPAVVHEYHPQSLEASIPVTAEP